MNSLAFVTHPSVRIKGSENNYAPSLCLDERCPIKAPHMHCPFCVKTDAYQDPVILKAHYRVKHVDKGIEFAGLKILRCCDHCDIVGIIKGEKRFKGAHWHCYRCRNGFNRRDEAIKHYKTHFRNPQTTFQIQITQDLNLPPGGKTGGNHQETISHQQNFPPSIENPIQDIIHPVLAQASLSESNVITTDGNVTGDKYKKMVKVKDEPLLPRGENHTGVHVDQGQTIMIIQGDNLESAFADHIMSGGEVSVLDKNSVDPNLSWEIKFRMEEEEKNEYKARMEEYKNQVDVMQQRIQELESQHPTSQLRVQDLLASLSLGDESKQRLAQQISKYLEELQSQSGTDLSGTQTVESQHQHLLTSDGIINQLTNSAHSQDGNVELATDVRTSLTHQVLQSDSPEVTQLGSITGPYQVIASNVSTNLSHHNSEENPIPDSIENNDSSTISASGKPAHHDNDNNSIYSAPVTSISMEEAREVKDDMFQPVGTVGSHNDHEIIVAQVVSSGDDQSNIISQKLFMESGNISDACNNSRIINIDGSVESERLLQVMAASAQGDHGSGTFIMETESGQQIIIQRAEEPTDTEQALAHHKLEPEPKRQRFLEEN